MTSYVRERYPKVRIFHEDRPDIPEGAEVWSPGMFSSPVSYFRPHFCDKGQHSEPIDLVVTLGGDGTILHASSLFKVGAVPPVLSFSMGTLGFLLPFRMFRVP